MSTVENAKRDEGKSTLSRVAHIHLMGAEIEDPAEELVDFERLEHLETSVFLLSRLLEEQIQQNSMLKQALNSMSGAANLRTAFIETPWEGVAALAG